MQSFTHCIATFFRDYAQAAMEAPNAANLGHRHARKAERRSVAYTSLDICLAGENAQVITSASGSDPLFCGTCIVRANYWL